MISLPTGTRGWLAAGKTDMRKGVDGLSAVAQTVLREDPLSGYVFVFRGRLGDRVKVLWWDGPGMCLFYKRIEKATFVWPSLPGRGKLAKAMRYAITRMKRLRLYLKDGRLELDNNIAERSVRGIAVGKKNYLFVGSDSGGMSAAVIYTLVETAKLNKIDPQAWLSHVIKNIADHSMKKIDDLLPWNFAAENGAA